jgi:hypothetical protein
MRIPHARNPFLWLLLLLTAWACLAAPNVGVKTASWQNSGLESASGKMTGWEAAPRLGFGGLVEESASVPPVGASTTGTLGSAVDSIYSSMRPLDAEFPQLSGVNPNYVEGAGPGVNTNCVSCVNAAQQRLTGVSPSATADVTGYANQNGLLPSAPFGFDAATTPDAVINEMLEAGDGAARPLIIQQPGNVQHVINVVNQNGQVYFIDTQMGQIVTLQPNIPVQLGRPGL